MDSRLVALAVPFFFLLIVIELIVARARRRSVYRLADSIADLGCGMFQQVLLVFLAGTVIAGYTWVYEHARLVTWKSATVPWVLGMIGVDFLFYWWHRLSHGVNILWAGHVIHHQSEDYNLAVALRQAIFTSYTSQLFYVVLAFLGVPPLIFLACNAISTLYQFWIHTRLVDKLPWLDGWLNTPSNHRVHHAINPRYLDRNHGAILIVWDRIFGTFQREDEEPIYGVVKPFQSFNPIWAQLEPFVALGKLSLATPRWADKVWVWFASPAWSPAGVPPYPGIADGSYLAREKHDVASTRAMSIYVVVQFAGAVLATAALMFLQAALPRAVLAAGAVLVVITLATCAGLLEGKRWAKPLEGARLLAVLGGGAVLLLG